MLNKFLGIYQKNIDNILVGLLFLLAGLNFFQIINSVILTAVTMLILLITLSSFILYDKKNRILKIVLNSKVTLISGPLIFYIFYLFFANKIVGTVSSYPNLINWIFIITTFTLMMLKGISDVNFKKISKVYCLIMFVFLLISIFMNLNNQNRSAMNFFGSSYDPNFMGLNFIFPALLSLHYFISEKNKSRWFFFFFMLCIIFFGFMVGSRGVTISVVAGIIVYLIFYLFSFDKIKINWKKLFFGLLIVAFLLFLIFLFIPKSTMERFKIENMLDFGGRLGIWTKSIKTFNSATFIDKLLGFGAGNFKHVVKYFNNGYYHVAHNFIFSNLIEYGLLGLGTFLVILVNSLYCAFKKQNFLVFSVIISMILVYLTLDIDMLFWINLTICEIILNSNKLNKLFTQNKVKGN